MQPILFYHLSQRCSRAILGKNSNTAENLALTRVDIIIREWIANRKLASKSSSSAESADFYARPRN